MKIQFALSKPSIISHRGNLDGPNKDRENHPDYLEAALKKGYGIEFDVWFENGQWALGHDEPKYAVTFSYLLRLGGVAENEYYGGPRAWMHLKNLEAVQEMLAIDHYASCGPTGRSIDNEFTTRKLAKRINYFWHQEDDLTITNHGFIWVHPKVQMIPMHSAWVVPELKQKNSTTQYDYNNTNWTRASFVCVDYPDRVQELFNKLRQSKDYFPQ
jgi:hypothetical protein